MQVQYDIQAGTEDFSSFIASKSYYVDKTRFLRPLLTRTGVVALFTRPRRFGKTLTMTMLRDFLKVDRENPGSTQLQERLFKGLAVMEDRELCESFMGKHPVLFITLKDVAGENFADAVDRLADSVSAIEFCRCRRQACRLRVGDCQRLLLPQWQSKAVRRGQAHPFRHDEQERTAFRT